MKIPSYHCKFLRSKELSGGIVERDFVDDFFLMDQGGERDNSLFACCERKSLEFLVAGPPEIARKTQTAVSSHLTKKESL